MMIARIIVGSGSGRTVIDTVPNKDQRRSLANALKGHLFPSSKAYQKAKARGARSLAMALPA